MKKHIDADIWDAIRLRQGPSNVLISEAEQLSELKEAITCAVNEVVTAHVIYKIVGNEVRRYLNHVQRIENFKTQRRRERMLGYHPYGRQRPSK